MYIHTSERAWQYSVAVVPRPRLSACESYVDIIVGLNLAAYCYIVAAAAAVVTSPSVHHFCDTSRISRGTSALPSHNYFSENVSARGNSERELMSSVITAETIVKRQPSNGNRVISIDKT